MVNYFVPLAFKIELINLTVIDSSLVKTRLWNIAIKNLTDFLIGAVGIRLLLFISNVASF